MINKLINSSRIHIGIISRNFTLTPGKTIRTVLKNSHVEEQHLDFVIPIPVGIKKFDVLQGMKSSRYRCCIFGADEISDYKAANETGYDTILMASYGFDNGKRLITHGEVSEDIIFDTPDDIAMRLTDLSGMAGSLRLDKTA